MKDSARLLPKNRALGLSGHPKHSKIGKDKTEEMVAQGKFKLIQTSTYDRQEWRNPEDKGKKIATTLIVLQRVDWKKGRVRQNMFEWKCVPNT